MDLVDYEQILVEWNIDITDQFIQLLKCLNQEFNLRDLKRFFQIYK